MPAALDDMALRGVDDEAGVRDFIAVNAEAYATYGMPAEVFADLFDETALLIGDPAALHRGRPGPASPSPRP